MKRLIFMMGLIVGLTSHSSAQYQCDITSSGVELLNPIGAAPLTSLVASGVPAYASFVLSNQGVGLSNGSPCEYGVGQVQVKVNFPGPTFVSYYFKYDGPATYNTPKYTWTYSDLLNALVGVNTVPISTGFAGAEVENVLVSGVTAGSSFLGVTMQIINSASGDNPNNNSFDLPITETPATALPVILESFEGFGEKCNAQLKWSTSYEFNLKQYLVEVSKDGNSFEKAGTVYPINSNAGKYQFNTTQSSGLNYYRLKIIDNDGSYAYSKIVSVVTKCSDKLIKVFPNPVKADQLLSVKISGYGTSIKGDLYSSTGQFVKTYVLKNGANDLSVENLAQGFYTLRVSDNGTITETVKINVLK